MLQHPLDASESPYIMPPLTPSYLLPHFTPPSPLHPTTLVVTIQPPLTHPSQTYGRNFCSQLTHTNSQLTSGTMGPQIPYNPCQVMGLHTSHPFTKPCTLPLQTMGPQIPTVHARQWACKLLTPLLSSVHFPH